MCIRDRCKDESLRGTVKETITQVSRSKKWESKPVLDKDGNPMLNAKGKKILNSRMPNQYSFNALPNFPFPYKIPCCCGYR